MDYIQYITDETDFIVRDIEDFKVFTEQRYKYHPLHQHYELVKTISPKVLAILSRLRGIVCSSWESGSCNDDKIIKEAINSAAVELVSITKSTRALIVVLEGKYYSKLGCFCFEKQELKAGEKATYVMTFYLDPEMVNDPTTKNLEDVTMSYTFFSTDYYKQS